MFAQVFGPEIKWWCEFFSAELMINIFHVISKIELNAQHNNSSELGVFLLYIFCLLWIVELSQRNQLALAMEKA